MGPVEIERKRAAAASRPSVAYVTTLFPTMASFLENEVRGLIERGVDVHVYTLRPPDTHHQPEHEDLVPHTEWLGPVWSLEAWAAVFHWLVRRPRELLGTVVAMLWASRGSAYAMLGHVAYLPAGARLASLVERRDVPHLHGAWAHFPASVALLAARLTGRSFSMAGHAGSDLRRTQAYLGHKARAARFVTTCVERNAELLRTLAGPGARIECHYHGVSTERFDGRGRSPAGTPLLLAVGRLASTKGFDVAIEALAVLAARGPRPTLVLIGDGPEKQRLQRLAQERGVAAQVVFEGELPQPKLVPLYRRAWMIVAPSRELPNGRCDGIPNVITEAMAMGVPCVGTRAGGLDEIVVDGETGRLLEPEDPAGLAAAIEQLIREDERREAMGRRARALVRERFDSRRNFEQLYERFRACIGAGPAGAPVPATRRVDSAPAPRTAEPATVSEAAARD